ncbi:MAG: TonB-dependent receptor plug domain-containing protein [Hyphomicrobium sp.]
MPVRGFKANNDIFVDGIRNPGTVIPDVFSVEQVEIYKGPSGGIAGRSTIGGAINLITKEPDLNFNHYELATTVGTDNTFRSTLDLNQVVTPRLRRACQSHVRPARRRRPRHHRERAVGRSPIGYGKGDRRT